MGSCSTPISSLQHIRKICIISLFLLLFELASSIYLCFNLKFDAYTSIVFLLAILSMQFIKYSLCNLEFINTKTHRKSNEREREREMVVRHKGNGIDINLRPPPQLVSNHWNWALSMIYAWVFGWIRHLG